MPPKRRREHCKKVGRAANAAKVAALGVFGQARACGALVDPRPSPNHTSSAAARLSVAAATPEGKEKEARTIGVGDLVEVFCPEADVSTSCGSSWLQATVTFLNKSIGLYRVARTYDLSESLVVDRPRLRLLHKRGRNAFAAMCAADAASVARMEAWPEEQLRSAQDLLSQHDQQLLSGVRLRRNADKVWRAVVARQEERYRKHDEEHAAAAPARAAALARTREKRNADRARAPPPTRTSHPMPAYVNRHLGHVGGKGVGIPRLGPPPQNPPSPSGGGGGPVARTFPRMGEMAVTPTFLFAEGVADAPVPVIEDYAEWEALEHPPEGRDQ